VIALRPLRFDDLSPLAAWLADPETAAALPYTAEQRALAALTARLAEPSAELAERGVWADNALIGGARLWRHEGARGPWGSFELFLDPARRGQGLGKASLLEVERAALAWSASAVIQIAAFSDNERALGLYRGLLRYREVARERWWIGATPREVYLLSNLPEFFARRAAGFA
jgi:RimJ/RimL family protein N-acetyltransferase